MKSKLQKEIEELERRINSPKKTMMCPKCGLVRTPEENSRSCDVCKYCSTSAIQIAFDEKEFSTVPHDQVERIREKIYRKFLYNNPQFDETTFEKRLEEERKEHIEAVRFLNEHRVQSSTPSCPYCKSVYVEKITTGGRLLSTALFGLGSSKVGKQWHCKQCGSNF